MLLISIYILELITCVAFATNQCHMRHGLFLTAKLDDVTSEGFTLKNFKSASSTTCSHYCLFDKKCNFSKYNTALKDCQLLRSITIQDFGENVILRKKVTTIPQEKSACSSRNGNGRAVSDKDIYTSCDAALKGNNFQTASYSILPSGLGKPLFIECKRKNNISFAVIHHNNENETLVKGFEPKGSYKFYFTYLLPMDTITSIISQSQQCQQHTLARCHDNMFVTRSAAWLYGRNQQKLGFWGGGPSDGTGCACGITNSCANVNYKCNCDKNDKTWRVDEGNVVTKDLLPVMGIAAGDTGGETEIFKYTIGPLLCVI